MCNAFMSEMDQIGLFEVEYLVSYIWHSNSQDQDVQHWKNAVTSGLRSLKVIEHDSFW